MSAPETVLYDAPGPRARRRALIGSLLATALFVALIVVVLRRLAEGGQFDYELWGPLIDPNNELFPRVWELLGDGLRATLLAAAAAIAFSLVIGTVLGVARMMLPRWARIPIVGLIELFRGLPVVITIFLAYRVLPEIGVDVSPLPGESGFWYLVIGLTAYNSVIVAEIVRSGVSSLPSGQGEAARAIGMTEGQTMRTVLLPQAFRTMLPALISQLVVILKDTSLAGLLGLYDELLRVANRLTQTLDNPIQMLFVVGVVYILINYLLSRVAVWTERRLSSSGQQAAEHVESQASTAGA
jgi:glutamate transport system permease protein